MDVDTDVDAISNKMEGDLTINVIKTFAEQYEVSSATKQVRLLKQLTESVIESEESDNQDIEDNYENIIITLFERYSIRGPVPPSVRSALPQALKALQRVKGIEGKFSRLYKIKQKHNYKNPKTS